ncbi:MAG: hypothetical protein JXR26_09690 [Balneolaceae bacterium]|nr:hypothetical protein [Balneolaceae bacterium]
MKLVKTNIRPRLLQDVYTELRKEGYCSTTVFKNGGIGHKGDGIVFVTEIEEATRVQDGKQGAGIIN